MIVLVFNVGSTTLKFATIDLAAGERIHEGLVDRIGQPGGDAINHLVAANQVIDEHANIPIAAIGHRVVQGGDQFTTVTRVNANSLACLAKLDSLAPLHNPSARSVIEAIVSRNIPITQWMVFDTAYFTTLPPTAYRYAVSDSIYHEYGVRRYGFHGTSHRFVTQKALAYLPKSDAPRRIITLHLGGGASATASVDGIAIETSMGMTPLEGLVMATRTGDIDASVPLHLMRVAGMTVDQVDLLLNKQSGLVGLCGEADMRAILKRRACGDESASLAIEIYVHRLVKTIGSYIAVLGGLDALVFTAGVGENSSIIRELVTEPLRCFGIAIQKTLNDSANSRNEIVDISEQNSSVSTLVIATDEEQSIAEQIAEACNLFIP